MCWWSDDTCRRVSGSMLVYSLTCSLVRLDFLQTRKCSERSALLEGHNRYRVLVPAHPQLCAFGPNRQLLCILYPPVVSRFCVFFWEGSRWCGFLRWAVCFYSFFLANAGPASWQSWGGVLFSKPCNKSHLIWRICAPSSPHDLLQSLKKKKPSLSLKKQQKKQTTYTWCYCLCCRIGTFLSTSKCVFGAPKRQVQSQIAFWEIN